MSHYNVNASVPKTLIQFLLRWAIDTGQYGGEASAVLQSVLETVISPELIPNQDPDSDRPDHDSESIVGPYELQDFFLYYMLRFGYRPSKVAFLALHAWGERERGPWPDLIPPERRNEYTLSEDQALARRVPRALLSHEPVQALGTAQRAEGRLGRVAVPPQRLARTKRQHRRGVARGTPRRRARLATPAAYAPSRSATS